jgi:hypothetical protein
MYFTIYIIKRGTAKVVLHTVYNFFKLQKLRKNYNKKIIC